MLVRRRGVRKEGIQYIGWEEVDGIERRVYSRLGRRRGIR